MVRQIRNGYRVDDANGQALAFVYGRDAQVVPQAKALTWDEARRITTIAVTFSPVIRRAGASLASRGPPMRSAR